MLYMVTPCKEDRKGFDETKCVFRHCKEGYYLAAQKKCSQIPVVDLICNIVGGKVVEFSEVEKCLASMEFHKSDSEYKDLIPTIKKYLEYYAYRDTMLPPPASYKDTKLDILAELDALQIKNYESRFNFYESVSLAINRLNDAHTSLTIPCANFFLVLLPYSFILESYVINGAASYQMKAVSQIISDLSDTFAQLSCIALRKIMIQHQKLNDIINIVNETPRANA